MRSDSSHSVSLWMTTETPSRPALTEDIQCDVCIIGAGIAGLSVAYQLSSSGIDVVVIDDGPLAAGETSRTTAHLSNALDDRYIEVEKLHGVECSRLAAQSHTRAIDRIEEIVAKEAIACDFMRVDGYLFLSPEDHPRLLDHELAAAHRAGLKDVQKIERAPIADFQAGPALLFPRQGQFHALKYAAGLVDAITRQGGRIYSQTHAAEITGGSNAHVLTSRGNKVRCAAVVVATNTPINDRVEIHTKQFPYRSFAIAGRIPKGSAPPALFWDTGDPYHYVRMQPGSAEDGDDLLIVGGEDHKTGSSNDADARYSRLEDWARERWPRLRTIEYRWSGQVMETQDYLGFIGRNPLDHDNVYIVTGDSGMGMTHGTIAGMLICDLIQGRWNPWEKLYDPSRIRVRAVTEFARENVAAFAQYRDYFTTSTADSAESVPPGEGAVVRRGLKMLAVYRDPDGQVHECSAVCPHLAALVRWNSEERSWDCPVHGSRFDCDGQVINGPANRGLYKVAEKDRKIA